MTTNDITGDRLTTGAVSDRYRDNYDLIFGNPKKVQEYGTTDKQDQPRRENKGADTGKSVA